MRERITTAVNRLKGGLSPLGWKLYLVGVGLAVITGFQDTPEILIGRALAAVVFLYIIVFVLDNVVDWVATGARIAYERFTA